MPATSARNVGLRVAALESVVLLPEGFETSVQTYVSASPFGSVLPDPSRMTDVPAITLLEPPAFALGGALVTGATTGAVAVTVTVWIALECVPLLTVREAI